jgi:tetratricopeptide (TPR) repeat protein
MYNIKALEEEWKRYNRKRRRPLYLLLLVVLAVSIAAIFWMNADIVGEYRKLLSSESTDEKMTKHTENIYLDKAFVSLEKRSRETLIDAPMEPDTGMDVSDIQAVGRVEAKPVHVKKKLHIEVIETGKNRNSFKELEKRFRLGHDTDDSLFLAKSYYERGNFKKAEYWALQTNKVNENIEESWLIFAKAKAKRGQRNEAIRILNAYIKRTHSVEAKVLLEKIKKGRV